MTSLLTNDSACGAAGGKGRPGFQRGNTCAGGGGSSGKGASRGAKTSFTVPAGTAAGATVKISPDARNRVAAGKTGKYVRKSGSNHVVEIDGKEHTIRGTMITVTGTGSGPPTPTGRTPRGRTGTRGRTPEVGSTVTIGTGLVGINRGIEGKVGKVVGTSGRGGLIVEVEGRRYIIKKTKATVGGQITPGGGSRPGGTPIPGGTTRRRGRGSTAAELESMVVLRPNQHRASKKEFFNQLEEDDDRMGGKLTKLLKSYPVRVGTAGGLQSRRALGEYTWWPQATTVTPMVTTKKIDGMSNSPYGQSWSVVGRGGGKLGMYRAVVTHEMGHHVHRSLDRKGGAKATEIISKAYSADRHKSMLSTYGATKYEEYFAEAYTAFHHHPERLTPLSKKMVEDVLALI